MGSAAYRTVSIPQFPFFNREGERREITTFLRGLDIHPRVLLLEGDGGLGKSRLLSECLEEIHCITAVVLNARDISGRQRSLVHSIRLESKRLRALLAKSHRVKAWTLELERLGGKAKRIVPAAGSLVPVVGAVAKAALEVALEDRDPENATSMAWVDHLIAICGLLSTLGPVVIVIDDFHRLTLDEQQLASTLVSGIIAVPTSSLRAVISTRPLQINSDAANSFFLSARNGELIRLPLRPLSRSHIQELAGAIFLNPGSSEPLVDLAEGSPQRLLELMIKLNLNGDLHCRDNLVILPTDLTAVTYLIDGIWGDIEANKLLYDLAATLATGTGALALRNVADLATALGHQVKDVLHAATTLEKLGIFTLEESGQDRSIRFSHDTLQEQISERIRTSSRISFVYYNEVSARFLEGLIGTLSASNDRGADDLLTLRVARARCLRDSVAHYWEQVSLSVAEECLAVGRFRTASDLAEPVITSLRQTESERSPDLQSATKVRIKSCYAVGDYEAITALPASLIPDDPYTIYASAMATIIQKKDDWFHQSASILQRALADRRMTSHAPLFESARAIALRERNDVQGGETSINRLLERGGAQFDPFVWHQFLTIASLFRGGHAGLDMARVAVEFFNGAADLRMSGISATNLSILMAAQGDLEAALAEAARSEEFFKDAGSDDVIFPLLNQAALLISTGRSELALPQLRSHLFRKLPDERRLAVLNDLALAQWAAGTAPDIAQLKDEAERGENSWLKWITAFNLVFLELDGGRHMVSRDRLLILREELRTSDPDHRSAPFWNALLQNCADPGWIDLTLERRASASPLESLAVPERNVGRPVFLSFGRI